MNFQKIKVVLFASKIGLRKIQLTLKNFNREISLPWNPKFTPEPKSQVRFSTLEKLFLNRNLEEFVGDKVFGLEAWLDRNPAMNYGSRMKIYTSWQNLPILYVDFGGLTWAGSDWNL